jgi:hypothetical protein
MGTEEVEVMVAVSAGERVGEGVPDSGVTDAALVAVTDAVLSAACTVSAAAVCTSPGGGICSNGILQARIARTSIAAASFVL